MSAHRDFVRTTDPDRYLCTLFAKPKFQQALFSLYTFYLEISDIPYRVKEPQLGQIRLQWWRDILDSMRSGSLSKDFISEGICEVNERYTLTSSYLYSILDTRAFDLDKYQPETTSDLLAYLKGTSGAVSLLALDIIGINEPETRSAVEEVAIAYGLIGILRSTNFLAAHNRILLSKELLQNHKVSAADILHRSDGCRLKGVSQQVVNIATEFLVKARVRPLKSKRDAMCCLLLATLTNLYIARLARFKFNALTAEINDLTPLKPWILTLNSVFRRF